MAIAMGSLQRSLVGQLKKLLLSFAWGRRKGMQMGKSRVFALLASAAIVASACSSTSATPTAAPASQAPATQAAQSAAPATQAPATKAPDANATLPPTVDTSTYKRTETLYTSGKQWG